MRYTRGKFNFLWFPEWFSDAFLLRRHPTGKLWMFYRWGYRKYESGKWDINLGPVSIFWGKHEWMA